MAKIVEIPVFATGNSHELPIGKLTVDAEALPLDHRFCFALAYRYGEGSITELLYVFPVKDANYFEFLKKELKK